MHIACVVNSGKPYLQVMENYSVTENGKRKDKKRTVRNLGPLSRFDDGRPDFLGRLRQSFKDGAPIIDGLADLVGNAAPPRRVRMELDRDDDSAAFSDPKNIGYFVLDALYDALGIYDVLNLHKSRTKIGYDLNGLVKLLVFGRALSPGSKIATFGGRDRYVFGVASSDKPIEVYRTLDVLDEKAESIQRRMNRRIAASSIGRNTEMCFYDVTNFWFEIHENDPDTADENGNVIRPGLRKKGVSKERRGEPIVQMGLFIDDNGIPIAYRLFPGNNTDQTTLRPALSKTLDTMGLGRVIVVADGGLNNGPNIAHLLDRGNGYILSRSTRKSDRETKRWMLEEDGYEWDEAKTFKMKSMVRRRRIKDAGGRTREIQEKLVCYWSRKHYDREVHENRKFMEYLDSVIANPDKLKDRPRKIERFLVETQIDKGTGEILDATKHLSVDMDRVREYLALLGYYTVMTSETEKGDREIIHKYHGLSRIEDSFRITKSDLEGRPVFVRTPEHINAHFLICFITLTMVRLIQYRMLKSQGKDTLNADGWESGLTAERIQAALDTWQADALPGGYWRLTKPDEDLRGILEAFGVNGDLRLPTGKELRQFKYGFDKAALM